MQHQLNAILLLGCIGYGLYLAWNFLVLLVTAPRGSLTEALAAAMIDEDEEDRQRRRRRRDEHEESNLWYQWEEED